MYHADGEECREYSVEEILGLSSLAKKYKTYHTTFFNIIKSQINSMTNIDDIIPIDYDVRALDETHLTKLTEIVGDLESLGFTLEVVEDTTNYDLIKNDVNIDSLIFQPEVVSDIIENIETVEEDIAEDQTV